MNMKACNCWSFQISFFLLISNIDFKRSTAHLKCLSETRISGYLLSALTFCVHYQHFPHCWSHKTLADCSFSTSYEKTTNKELAVSDLIEKRKTSKRTWYLILVPEISTNLHSDVTIFKNRGFPLTHTHTHIRHTNVPKQVYAAGIS